jgi:hypothetical protein
VLTFLTDVFDPESCRAISFSAVRSEVSALCHAVAAIGLTEQRRVGFAPALTAPKRKAGIDSALFRICGRNSQILTDKMIGSLRLAMPPQYRPVPWKLLFDMQEDGISFSSFYEKAAPAVPQLLVLLTDKGAVLGAFVPQGFHIDRYTYGSGEVFVWSMAPEVAVYHCSGTNTTFVSASADDIVIGGPKPAIYLGACFKQGFTESCLTFGSPRLIEQDSFHICNVELWGISKGFT